MATRNSSITAKIGLDITPLEKGLGDAQKAIKQGVAKMENIKGPSLGPGPGWSQLGRSPMGAGWSPLEGPERKTRQLLPDRKKFDARDVNQTNLQLVMNGRLLKQGAQSMDAFGQSSKNAGQGILQLGYAMDDLQYGIKGVANNIPQLVQSLTGSLKWAGWIGIIVTAGTVLYNLGKTIWETINPTAKLAAANEEAAESYKKLTEEMKANAAEQGRKSGESEEAKLGRQDAGRENQTKMDEREERIAAAKDAIRMAEAQRLEGAERLRREQEITNAAEERVAKAALKRAEERLAQDDKQLKAIHDRIEANKAELAAIDQKREAKAAAGEGALSPAEANREAFLFGEMPGLYRTRETLQERAGEGFAEREDARQRVEKELPLERTKGVKELQIQSEKDAAAAAEKLAEELKKAADLAEDAKKAKEKELKAQQELARAEQEKKEGIEKTKRDISISEIKSPSRRKRAEAAAKLADRTKELVDQGIDPGEAADLASREQKVAGKAAGDRTLRTTGPTRPGIGGGLGAFSFGQRGSGAMLADTNVPTALEASQSRGRAALKRAGEDAGKVAVGSAESGRDGAMLLRAMLDKFDRLIEATAKTPAERAAPVRKE